MKKDKSKKSKDEVEEKSSKKRSMKLESMTLRYRPRVLENLIGQDHVVAELRGMLKRQQFPQTILLTGDSGCGKTTTARMIARYLFCTSPDKKTFEPCGECQSCRYGDGHPDLHEMNMAEQRGIDDVRALIQSSKSMPTVGENRIYIIDEIHAMTTQAAQAFLKPLEEPPAATMWILCTTNPEKLPTTILGRCHKFNVQRIAPEVMGDRLKKIAKKEGVNFKEMKDGDKVLKLITDLGNGHMRDTISLLEKLVFALASGVEFDTKTLMTKILATAESDLDKGSATLLAAILGGDLKGMIKCLRQVNNARGLLSKMRWLLMYILDNAVGEAKYAPYNAKLFMQKATKDGIKISLTRVVRLQYVLVEMESKFNSMNVDENVIMLSMFGNEIASMKKE